MVVKVRMAVSFKEGAVAGEEDTARSRRAGPGGRLRGHVRREETYGTVFMWFVYSSVSDTLP